MVKKAVLILVPLVVIGGLIVWRLKTKSGAEQQLKTGAAARRTPAVEVGAAAPATISGVMLAAGTLESPYKVQLTPKASGRIESIAGREGDSVAAGQVLIRIDPATAQSSLAQAQANAAQARARLAQAKIEATPNAAGVRGQVDQQTANLNNANAELTQTRRTVEATQTSLTGDIVDAKARVQAAEAALNTANATLEKEKASQRNLKVKVDRAKELLDKGYIAEREYEDAVTALDVQDRQVQIANTVVASSTDALRTARTQLEQANTQLNTAKAKGKADIAAAQARVNQAQSSLRVAQANKAMNPAYEENLNALRAAVNAADAQVRQAQTTVTETEVRSPINGVITTRNADEGAMASPGTAVLIIQTLDWLFFTASIPVEQGDRVRLGQVATIAIEGTDNKQVKGAITNINPSADPQSRQITLRIRLENKDHSLRPGMFGKINFPTDAKKVAVAVPKEAIIYAGKQPTVAVVKDDSKVEIRNVVLGVSDEKVTEIKEGIKAGETIVTLAYGQLRDGAEVKVGKPGEGGGGPGGGGARGGQGGGAGGPRQGGNREGGSREGVGGAGNRPPGNPGEGRRESR